MESSQILQRLKDGNLRYVAHRPQGDLRDSERKQALTTGQEPWAIVLSCADSRVVPELAFDTGLGELFVIRVAGNIPNPETIGSIEYAVAHCGTRFILVLGHESCGAVAATQQGGDLGPNINQLVSYIQPAIDELGKEAPLKSLIHKNAENTKKALLEKSSILKDFVEKEGLTITTGYYNLSTGAVDFQATEA